MTDNSLRAAALAPLIKRVRTDITAVKKPSGEQAWTTQPLTSERLARHLNGGPPRGVCPIKPGESVTMVALLDFDSHKGEIDWPTMSETVRRVAELLELADGAAPILFRSSGGRGVHLYLLWDEPQDARSVRLWLRDVLESCGLRSGAAGLIKQQVEIFPKQDSVPIGGSGNQFILPLAGKSAALEWDELAGVLLDTDTIAWPSSLPVPPAPPREEVERPIVDLGDAPEVPWRSALDSLRNGEGGSESLDYDAWRNVIFAIHHETGGSSEGLQIAHAWSARSAKYDSEFLESRVWPYVRTSGERGAPVITGRTIMSIAGKAGWYAPLDDSDFEPIADPDGDPFAASEGAGDPIDDLYGGGDLDSPRRSTRDVADAVPSATTHTHLGGGRDLPDARGPDVEVQTPHLRAAKSGDGDDGLDVDDLAGLAGLAGEPGLARADSGDAGGVARAADGRATAAPGKRGSVPLAKHLTTDQSNANRIVRAYGKRVLVAAGRWHVFDGRRWRSDEADVYRYACQLSKLIADEADEWQRKVDRLTDEMMSLAVASVSGATNAVVSAVMGGKTTKEAAIKAVKEGGELDPDKLTEIKQAVAVADALRKWSLRSEMKATIEAAIGLARKMLTVDAALLDADPMLLNCRNGTVDLRTGLLREHRASDMITKMADVDYAGLDTDCSRWERVVAQITREQEVDARARVLAPFLQRWFGYCATALTREQVFVVHWGGGQNGKSTILETVTRVLGDYSGVAAPGLVASTEREGSERHPTEIASLLGLRMVTAHESNEGAVLREGFIKWATGGDRLTARFMREDFFEFDPTHKIQLLTNHKPTIKGQDMGIWRRVLLVPYLMSFGSPDKVARGEALAVADTGLMDALKGDAALLSSVLTWVVRGAVAWWSEGGLRPPEAVLSASRAYQSEQDRVGQFVRECCQLAPPSVMAALLKGEPGWHTAAYRVSVPAPVGAATAAAGGPAAGVMAGLSGGGSGGPTIEVPLREWSEPLTHGMAGLYPAYVGWCREGGYHSLARGRFVDGLTRAVPGFRVAEVYEGGKDTGRRKTTRCFGLRLLDE